MQDVTNKTKWQLGGAGVDVSPLYFMLNFSVNPKLL